MMHKIFFSIKSLVLLCDMHVYVHCTYVFCMYVCKHESATHSLNDSDKTVLTNIATIPQWLHARMHALAHILAHECMTHV